jgi:hypothetical protein
MLPSTLIKGFDKGRLKSLLVLFFLALAVPTGVLIWQAYSQLKWEAFAQYRGMAEELTVRMDATLANLIDGAESRSFADYSFLVVSGDLNANFTRPSPLSGYPVTQELPGLIGHFQVDNDGYFSTPLLPQSLSEAETYGIAIDEYERRRALANEVQTILSDNRLVQAQAIDSVGRKAAPETIVAGADMVMEEIAVQSPVDTNSGMESSANVRISANANADPGEPAMARALEGQRDDFASGVFEDDDESVPELEQEPAQSYSQEVFDKLNLPASAAMPSVAQSGAAGIATELAMPAEKERANSLGKVGDLKLDSELEKKSEAAEETRRQSKDSPADIQAPGKQVPRRKRVETDAIAEVVVNDVRISTFESEIDPFEFSLLNSGHFVMFRKVWRDGERYIQGLLIDQRAFIDAVVDQEFRGTALSQMSNLIVAFQDDVIHTANGQAGRSYASSAGEMQGDLLYQGRLSAPLDNVGLIFSINRLPAGPGASVLGWVTLVLAMVFLGGF